jgi:hypothetical protein
VYKKTDEVYQLKMKASRAFYSDVDKRFGSMPFTLRAFEEEKKARMGVLECVNHKLLEPFTVLYEKDTEFVAQFKFTVLLMPSGSHKITGLPIDTSFLKSEFNIEDDSIKALLNRGVGHKGGKKKKKSTPKTTTDTTGDKVVNNGVNSAKSED